MSENTLFNGTEEEGMERITKVLKRAQAGDRSALPDLQQLYAQAPGLIDTEGGDLAARAELYLVCAITGKNLAFREALFSKLKIMRAELCGPNPTSLEKLLVERVVATWLYAYHADCTYAQARDITFAHGDYLQRQQDRAHRRYLSAIRTLAVVRRLALPIQVDVNVAGTVETTPIEPAATMPSRFAQLSAN